MLSWLYDIVFINVLDHSYRYFLLFRRKVSPPQFETLNEFTDESDESKKNSPDEPVDVEHEEVERTDMKQPNPVDIGKYRACSRVTFGLTYQASI